MASRNLHFAWITARRFSNISMTTKKPYDSTIPLICQKFSKFEGGSIDLDMSDTPKGMATLCINNPTKYNAISGKMMVDLLDAVDQLKTWKEGRSLLIYGANNSFCGGLDFKLSTQLEKPDDGVQMSLLMHVALLKLQSLPLITACYVQGKALGGGAEITTATDFRIIAPDASVRWVHLNMGLIPGCGGMTRLTKLIGPSKALKMIISRKEYSPNELLDLGYCDTTAKSLEDAKDYLIKLTTDVPSDVLRATKLSAHGAAVRMDIIGSLENERELFKTVWRGPAHLEAIQTFANKKSNA